MNNKNIFTLICFLISFLILLNSYNYDKITYKSGAFDKLLIYKKNRSMDVYEFYIDNNKFILENKFNEAFNHKKFYSEIKKKDVLKITLNNGLINQIEFKGLNFVDPIKANNIKNREKILSYIIAFFFLSTGFYLIFNKNLNQKLTVRNKSKNQKKKS